ncbi:MAG: hypothetical protein ACXWCZ_10270 [Flavisolibacter sp.]
MKLIFTLISIACLQIALAQKVVDVSKENVNIGGGIFYSVGGNPFVNAKFVNLIEGTPYFRKDWMNANLIMPLGKEYKDVEVKLNLFDQQVHYKGEKDIEIVATSPIKEVILFDELNDSRYHFIHSSFIPVTTEQPKKEWFQRLDSGTASVYKTFTKEISENKPYGSATVEQKMRTIETYLIHYNNTLLEIKKIKDAPKILANKEKELEEFMSKKDDKKAPMDERVRALIKYYNSIL